MLNITPACKSKYPGAVAGVLAMGNVINPKQSAALQREKERLQDQLISDYAGQDRKSLRRHPILKAYHDYYRVFKKTYHVQLQLESVVWKKKRIPSIAALVEAMFMAELKNLLLTAGHDLKRLTSPIQLDTATGSEEYVRINGTAQRLKPGDMYIADRDGVLSSVLYGPDRRSRIQPDTREVIFTVYAPPGIGEDPVSSHLEDLQFYVASTSPDAETLHLGIYSVTKA